MKSKGLYSAELCPTRTDTAWRVVGPGQGLGFYSGYHESNMNFKTSEDAEHAARVAEVAHEAGYRQALYDIRKVLGVKEE